MPSDARDPAKMSHEQLTEALVALERSRRREAEQGLETQALLEGLRALTEARDTRGVFESIAAVLARFIPFDDAFLLAENDEGQLRSIYSTHGRYQDAHWSLGPTLVRVAAGEIVSLFDIAQAPEWEAQPEPIRARVGSALHMRLRSERSVAVLVLVSAKRAAFSKRDVRLLARLEPLTDQTLSNIAQRDAIATRTRELEQLNLKLTDAQSQLLQSEKMASVGQLAAGVAHEINNPIGFVFANLVVLKQYVERVFGIIDAYAPLEQALPGDHPELRRVQALKSAIKLCNLQADTDELLAETLDGVARVRKIVQDLKDFSHVDEAEWQRFDVHVCLDSTLNMLAHELKYKVDIIKQYGPVPLIACLPFQLSQVFVNLLMNAAQAIEVRGTVTIRTGSDGDTAWIAIIDTGRGIEAASLKRIFEPFFTTKPVGVGTGLGLSVTYSIVQRHGGTIEVASEPGCGTTFTIRLPIDGPHKALARPVARHAPDAATAELLVRDNR
jgi:two-component system NtrC family sensor kinase